MRQITLYKDRGVALVDDADYELVAQYQWHIDRGYAARTIHGVGIEYMHRLINQTPKGFSTDHVNGDKLDNRRANLRTCTQTLNNANSKLRKDNSSGHKGVVWHERNAKWQAQITIKGTCKYLGQFIDKDVALERYKLAAAEYFGEFANVDIR